MDRDPDDHRQRRDNYGPPNKAKALNKTLTMMAASWSSEASKSGARPISFKTSPRHYRFPLPVDRAFRYLENGYRLSHAVEKPDAAFLTPCSCPSGCSVAEKCSCIAESDILDKNNKPRSAYTNQGLLHGPIPAGVEIKECGPRCSCTFENCGNRVSQQPRNFHAEIFSKDNGGWGVRSTTDIQKGQVLGYFTGLLIPRTHVPGPGDNDADEVFYFDLDHDEQVGLPNYVPPRHKLYSVFATYNGNWTVFITNSTTPNLATVPVAFDVPVGSGMPYLAFFALDDIPALTEFTIDFQNSRPPPSFSTQLSLVSSAQANNVPNGPEFDVHSAARNKSDDDNDEDHSGGNDIGPTSSGTVAVNDDTDEHSGETRSRGRLFKRGQNKTTSDTRSSDIEQICST